MIRNQQWRLIIKKVMSIAFSAVFALPFAFGILTAESQAKPPTPCTHRCINQDTFFCCIAKFSPIVEECAWYSQGCY